MARTWQREDRGAVLALVAIFLLIFMIVAALAVDLSALERRGQTLQNTADAAALAGVATWTSTGDSAATNLAILDLLNQNGLDGEDILVAVDTSPSEIAVTITDTDPDLFFASFIAGSGGELVRDATARLEDCAAGCTTIVDLPTPFPPTSVTGSGDGFSPVAVGNRFYALNHGGDEIACVDRRTKSACWTGRMATPFAGQRTGPVNHTVVVDTRLFWVAQGASQLSLFCWQTITESPCDPTPIAALDRADALDDKHRVRGGGVVAVGPRVFIFTDDHRTRCVNTVSLTTCAGYEGGLPTGLNQHGFAPLDPAMGVTGSNIDRVLNEDTGQIFHTLQIDDTAQSAAIWTTGIFVDCWDTTTNAVCQGFTPYRIHDVSQRQYGRLFLHRTPDGTPDGVCSTGPGDVQCIDFLGNEDPALEAKLAPLDAALPAAASYAEGGMGVHTYHVGSNRLILTTPRRLSTMYCWDFNTESYCGSLYGFANGGETQDYGFVVEGACLYGLGHTSIFWAFTSDMTPGCPGATTEVTIDKCTCGTEQRWGLVGFNFDIGEDSPFLVLNVQVLDEDNNLVRPDDGSEWIQMVGRASDVIDLSSIPTTYDRLKLRVYLETTTTDPWDAADPPALIFGFREMPQLVE